MVKTQSPGKVTPGWVFFLLRSPSDSNGALVTIHRHNQDLGIVSEDCLSKKVSALESVISKGGKVAEKDVVNVIELLMNELIKLDAIVADGDVKLRRKIQWTYHMTLVARNQLTQRKCSNASAPS